MHYFSFCVTSLLFFFFNVEWFFVDFFSTFYNEFFLFWLFDGYYSIGIDGISLPFLYLTLLLIPLCILYNWSYSLNVKSEYSFFLLCIELSLVFFFMTSNIFLFSSLFECLLFPFFPMFGLRAVRVRKTHASFLLVLYTLFGSLSMLSGIIYLYSRTGCLDLFILSSINYQIDNEFLLCSLFLISFYSKIPIVPLHNWLPEAHVEAPTELSVLLAGLILKVGTYGFLRIILPIFPSSFYYLSPVLLIFVTISVFYSSATAVSQSDIKKIIAYSSIAHMNISIIGLCVGTVVSICGSVFLMFSHGIISSGLFFLIGMLYERYGTKIVKYYTGLICFMPLFSVFFFLSVLGNIGFPFTCGFIGEALIILGLPENNNVLFLFVIGFRIFVGAVYNMWLYNKLFCGVTSLPYKGDMTLREFFVMAPLAINLFLFGLFPNLFLHPIHNSLLSYLSI
jgi:proton-translocating NADH-quinone oxidoreductase chain M